MPRARNIKPSLFKNELLGKADPLLTILFASLWCLADREGRLEDRPEKIEGETFPYQKNEYRKDINTDELLNELQRMGFIQRYEEQHFHLIQVIKFKQHQSPHHTEKGSTFPACSDKSLIHKAEKILTVKAPLATRSIPVVKRSDSLIPDSLIPDSLIPENTHRKKSPSEDDPDFERFWKIYPKRPDANKTQARKAWSARLKEGVVPEDMLRGAHRYRLYCEGTNVEPRYIKQAATFVGPDRHFLNDHTVTGKRSDSQDFVNRLTGKRGDDDDRTIDI